MLMPKVFFLLFLIDLFATQLVFSQYSNNDGYNRDYNQIDREVMPTNQYNDQSFDDFNQQKSRSYPSEHKEMPKPYQFEYNTDDGYGNKQDRHEKVDEYGNVVGSYGFIDSNGIYRKVHYTAGPEGFKAKINSNEPFLKPNANPADVDFFVEEPPQSAINYGKYQTNGYTKDESNDYFDDIDNNEMNDQSYRASVNRVRGFDNRYINNDDNRGFGRIRSFLDMIRPKQNVRTNQEYYPSLNSFKNQNNNKEMDVYTSMRRYKD